MKKQLFLLLPFVLSVFLFTNCDPENDSTEGSKLVKKVVLASTDGTWAYTFSYNDQELVNKVVLLQERKNQAGTVLPFTTTYDIVYKTGSIVITENATEVEDDGTTDIYPTTTHTATLNANKNATVVKSTYVDTYDNKSKEDMITLTYDASNYLTKVENKYDGSSSIYTYNSIWTAGNKTSIQGSDLYTTYEYTYEYGSISNKKANLDLNYVLQFYNDDVNIFSFIDYCGQRSNNLVSKRTVTYNDTPDVATTTYEVDTEGYPTKATMSAATMSESATATITYTK